VLVELDGVRLLTDPVLRGRIGPLRRISGAAETAAIGRLDAVLLSHLHYDHLDLPTLVRLGRSLRIVAPAGAGKLLRRRRFGHVEEVREGDEVRVGAVTVRATPAEHEERRGLGRLRAAAVGYLVSGSAHVYFAGDTDLFDGMSEIAHDLDVALLPVAGWGSRVPAGHLNPRSAAEALVLLRPNVAVPIHWGTYRRVLLRSSAVLQAPAETFAQAAAELAPEVDVRILAPGGSLELEPRTEAA
jgi:L-ascorbate metabolism protein UlaG (beta-lactamase superfamily)